MSEKTKIKLLKKHTHAGIDYRAGEEIEITADSAKWLISVNVAEEINKAPQTKSVLQPTDEV